jgi:hypothetical protein
MHSKILTITLALTFWSCSSFGEIFPGFNGTGEKFGKAKTLSKNVKWRNFTTKKGIHINNVNRRNFNKLHFGRKKIARMPAHCE